MRKKRNGKNFRNFGEIHKSSASDAREQKQSAQVQTNNQGDEIYSFLILK